jgi:hypothetical protein
MDDFLVRLEKQIWAIWLPVVASAALALGFALGTLWVCKRTAGGTGNTWNGSITTTARGSRCTIPDHSATAFQEPLRRGQVAGGEKSRVLVY